MRTPALKTVICCFFLLASATALAQAPGPDLPPPPGGMGPMGPGRGPGKFGPGGPGGGERLKNRPPEELRRDVMERMRAMRAWKLSEELKLDEATSAKLFPLLSKYDDRAMEVTNEIGALMRSMRAETEAPKPDNARLTGYIDKLLALRAKQRTIEDERLKELRRVLSPVQQAKLVVLMPRIEQHFRERIRDVMIERRRGGAPDDMY